MILCSATRTQANLSDRRSRKALVVGGSIGGLFAALLLRQRGWDVHVSERVPTSLSGRGAGIVTQPPLWRILDMLGLDPHRNFGVAVERRLTLARDGSVQGTLRCPQVMTSWDRLFSMLRAEWPAERYTLGEELRGIDQQDGGVVATFRNGTQRFANLLIGADGFRSTVRTLAMGDIPPRYAGYVAWRGLVPESAIPADAYAMLGGVFGFCLPEGEQMLGYLVAGEDNDLRPGYRRYNFVWYRPADERVTLPNLLTDESGHTHAVSIPPPLIRPEIITDMRARAEAILAPQFAAIVRATAQPFLQPIYDLEAPCLTTGRIALVGDSGFVVRPHVGAGVTKAAEDALALADALDAEADQSRALLRYDSERLPAGRRMVQRGRHLGAYMQAQISTAEERDAADRHRTPEAVMAETALMGHTVATPDMPNSG